MIPVASIAGWLLGRLNSTRTSTKFRDYHSPKLSSHTSRNLWNYPANTCGGTALCRSKKSLPWRCVLSLYSGWILWLAMLEIGMFYQKSNETNEKPFLCRNLAKSHLLLPIFVWSWAANMRDGTAMYPRWSTWFEDTLLLWRCTGWILVRKTIWNGYFVELTRDSVLSSASVMSGTIFAWPFVLVGHTERLCFRRDRPFQVWNSRVRALDYSVDSFEEQLTWFVQFSVMGAQS